MALYVNDTQWDMDQDQLQSNSNTESVNNNYMHHSSNSNNLSNPNIITNHQNGIISPQFGPQNQNNTNIALPRMTTSLTIEVSYHDQQTGIFGCQHYARNCYLRAECCKEWYVCRFCHDERNEEIEQSNTNNGYDNCHQIKPHKINRYATKYVKCMRCGTEQQSAKYCMSMKCTESDTHTHTNSNSNSLPNVSVSDHSEMKSENDFEQRYCLGLYYCDICKFYDNKCDKEIFHCLECGLCRLGKKSDYIHCQRCGCCLNYKYYAKHPCIENSLKSDCPICFTYLFKSREPVTFFMPCGHPIHYECLMQYAKVGNWKCPVCRTEWYDEQSEKRKKLCNAIIQKAAHSAQDQN